MTWSYVFFGVSLVETALSRLDEEEAFIEPGALFPFVCDAPFSDLDDVNTESAAEMVCKLNCQKIIFVSPGAYKEGVQKTLQRLKNEGYTNVFNLYGGIFEWKNNNFQVFDLNEKATEKVHVYDKNWSKWLIKGEKVF